MKFIRSAPVLFFALTLFFGAGQLAADDQSNDNRVFKINGKPVPEIVASVNGVDLPSQYLENQMTTFKIFMNQRGQTMSPEKEERLAREALKSLVDQELLLQKRKDFKIEIDPKQVDQRVDKISEEFPSREMFLNALAVQKLTMDMLKKSIEKQLVEQEFIRREVAPKVNVGPASVEKYYKENKEKFLQLEKFTMRHIFVQALHDMVTEKAADPESQKKADRLMALVEKDALDKIRMVQEKLKMGEDFAELARLHSEDDRSRVEGGTIGTIFLSETIPELAEAAQKLKVDQISEIIISSYGYHILQVTEKFPESTLPLSEVKSDILNILLKKEVEKKKESLLSKMRKSAKIKLFL